MIFARVFMETLDDFQVGDKAILWCIGWNAWDTEVVKIVNKGIFIKVEYENGRQSDFSSTTKAKLI